ncbi:MAG: hypothetical protein ABIJ21_02165 [Nanoarchaeota archaeon]
MKRDKRVTTYTAIHEILQNNSFTIHQISEQTSINWKTVQNAITTMQALHMIRKDIKNGKTYYSFDPSQLIELDPETLLGLPLNKEQKQATRILAKNIAREWKAITKKQLKKTFLQKMMVAVIKKEQLDIPYGLYLYGECTLLKIDPDQLSDAPAHTKTIRAIIKAYEHIPSTEELLKKLYIEEGNTLYLSRLQIANLLMQPFTTQTIDLIKTLLNTFLLSIKKTKENEDLFPYINGFASILIRLTKEKNIEELESCRPAIDIAFKKIWEIIATYNLYASTRRFFDKNTQPYYLIRKEYLLGDANMYLSELQDSLPKETINDPLKRFKGIQGKQSK